MTDSVKDKKLMAHPNKQRIFTNIGAFKIGRILLGICALLTCFSMFTDVQILKYQTNLAYIDQKVLNGSFAKIGGGNLDLYLYFIMLIRSLFIIAAIFIIFFNFRCFGSCTLLLSQGLVMLIDNASICPSEFGQNPSYRNEKINNIASQFAMIGAVLIYLTDKGKPQQNA
ncbi:UNKNOWN [Stylonychia lemnae]|uniref:Uncharacterized protein n=1 Tax=Stylonychia lemnae TaxID=5949 RepID=A0A078ALB5_STYLE|nr:UNKNOWN [Stylonychia lemnae]|eukprot:CDW82202.1 UNKNOWN [Stylonychia lemnae]